MSDKAVRAEHRARVQNRRSVRRSRYLRLSRRSRKRGAALPVVLVLSSMMLATSVAWFETSITAARGVANLQDELIAFHAADAALQRCAQRVLAGTLVVAQPTVDGEPAGWRLSTSFDANAFAPIARWTGSVQPPQCLPEAWRLASRPAAQAWLVTARGYGRVQESQVWLQLQLVVQDGAVERHWRRIAARPF
jgi:Tfp pilus assembly protein PilX